MADGEIEGSVYEVAMWRGGVNVKLETVATDVKEIRDSVKILSGELKAVQLTLQAQVTKLVIIVGIIVWLAGVGATIGVKFIFK